MTNAPLMSALDAGRRIAAGETTSVELVRDVLARIDEREATLRAWAHLDEEVATAQARARDAERPRSPLHGVPVGIKDVIDTVDFPTERGTVIHRGRQPTTDAACVTALRDAGAVIVGKTVSTELATWHPGPTTNPHDPTRTPGGSSSGSAASVGAGTVPLALGTQTVGSTIRPGAFCGAWALKPTHGRLPMDGIQPLAGSLDTPGLFAGDAAGLGALLSVLAGEPVRPLPSASARPRIAVVRTPWWDQADEDGRDALEDAARRCARAGARVEDLTLALPMDALLDAHWTVMEYETARALRPEYDMGADDLSDQLRGIIESGAAVDPDTYARAVRLGEEGKARIDAVLAGWDAILTLTAPGEAPVGLAWTGEARYCRLWSLLGAPAVSVPGLTGPHGTPIGMQLIGRRNADHDLLAVAAWLGALLAPPPS